jgi:LysR family nitrogen assimilation transcriptional regulator
LLALHHLAAFVAVARHGSISLAAASLYTTRTTLGRQIAALERELGVHLLHRTPHGVTLTAHGRALAQQARHLEHAVEALLDATRRGAAVQPDASPDARE